MSLPGHARYMSEQVVTLLSTSKAYTYLLHAQRQITWMPWSFTLIDKDLRAKVIWRAITVTPEKLTATVEL